MSSWRRMLFLLVLTTGFVISCEEKPIPDVYSNVDDPLEGQASLLTQKINQFIFSTMDDVYLWYKELPDIDLKYEFDSKEYFNKLLYIEDRWSFITDDIVSFENSLQGIETSYGYSLAFGKFQNTGNIRRS